MSGSPQPSISHELRVTMLDRVFAALLRQPVDDSPPEPPDNDDAAGLASAAPVEEEV
jgi:hypothetical protein